MDLSSVAERVAAIERSAVTLSAQRCLHATDRFSGCSACLSVCPVGAIVPGKPPVLTADACQTCLACLPVCPTGAFSADDAVPTLLECAARLEAPAIELFCQRHPQPDFSPWPEAAGVRVRGCLAGLGVGALVALAALGSECVRLRADACAPCAWGTLQGQLVDQVRQAQQLLAPWGLTHKLELVSEPPTSLALRRVIEADNPPVSRRDLFRLAARRGQVALARAVTETGGATGPRPARERQRVLNALAGLPARAEASGVDHAVAAGYALVTVSSACSACAACARACPTGALRFERATPDAFRLNFQPRLCTGCEACVHVCAPEALSVSPAPTFEAVFGPASNVVVQAGGLVRCDRCGTWFAAALGQKLCPPCAFRRQHPFGARPMPGSQRPA